MLPISCLTAKEELFVTEQLAYLKASTKWANQRFQCSFVQDENACIQIFCSYIFNSKILLLNCDWSLPPLSLSLFLSLSSTHTHAHSLSTFLDVLFSHSISLTHKPSLELHAQVSERERMRKKKMVE